MAMAPPVHVPPAGGGASTQAVLDTHRLHWHDGSSVGSKTHCPVPGSHRSHTGSVHRTRLSKHPGKGSVGSQPACSQPLLMTVQVLRRSKQPGKGCVGSQPACSQPALATLQVSWRSKHWNVVASQPACSQPVLIGVQILTRTGRMLVAVPPRLSMRAV